MYFHRIPISDMFLFNKPFFKVRITIVSSLKNNFVYLFLAYI